MYRTLASRDGETCEHVDVKQECRRPSLFRMMFSVEERTSMKNLTIASVLVCMIAIACVPSCKNNAGLVTPNPPVVTDQSSCQAACDNLKSLGCPQAAPIDMGTSCSSDSDCKDLDGNVDKGQTCVSSKCETSCTNFCIVTENQGVWLDPPCVAKITKCSDIESCPSPQKPTPTCTGPGCALSQGK